VIGACSETGLLNNRYTKTLQVRVFFDLPLLVLVMTQTTTNNLHDLTRPELVSLLSSWGYSEYHAGFLWDQLYRQLAGRFGAMSIRRADLQEHLQHNASLTNLQVSHEVHSIDGLTTKYLFSLSDGETVESVLMHYAKRATACR